jgi:hypothetical protein
MRLSSWPSSPGGGLQNRRGRCDSCTGLHSNAERGRRNAEWALVRSYGSAPDGLNRTSHVSGSERLGMTEPKISRSSARP